MAPVANKTLIFKEWPGKGFPVPGKTMVWAESTIDLDTVPLNGGYLVKALVVSIDPYLRRRMNPGIADFVITSFNLNDPIVNFGVGVVLRSEHATIKAGDHIHDFLPFANYVVLPGPSPANYTITNTLNLPWSNFTGVLGLAGKTAYYGWTEYASAKPGEVAFVSGAAGAVGAIVVQLAKAAGCKVIASAGTAEKCEYVKSLGADVVFNYKDTPTAQVLEKEGPVDVFWDNVGGEVLEAAVENAAQQARIMICGSIANYNATNPYGVKNLQLMLWREIHMYGFLMTRMEPKYAADFWQTWPAKVKSGEVKHKEHVVKGLDKAEDEIISILHGGNFGKSVLVIAED
ncbi:NAD(P)-binding protein [Epithele typhae]|uniref:NAD(P)-binding protein n=1 Tax=Epithele typhae TaxID=378194 RepID=UPI002007B1DA|nr:NAD(P)-binding protein [Epithele typhae]KAH9918933.1 NAD(P)-binding protein [Epithele typhae]